MWKQRNWKRVLAMALTVSLLSSTLSSATVVRAEELQMKTVTMDNTQEEQQDVMVPDVNDPEVPADTEIVPKEDGSENQNETKSQLEENKTPENAPEQQVENDIYQNGHVMIYNEKQLKAIGSGSAVYTGDKKEETFGTGETVVDETGQAVLYAMDGTYQLMNDISLNGESMWTLPENFTGRFISGIVQDTDPLYDTNTDTIYVYHNYQLVTIAGPESEKEPVMSNDKNPAEFGMGTFLYKDGKPADESVEAAQEYLTYDKTHQYVLSKNFTEQMPELLAATATGSYPLAGEYPDGRTYPGQVTYHDDTTKKDYILIGNETQLRAIGSNKHVNPRLYIYKKPGVITGLLGRDPLYIPYYPGDADLGLGSMPDIGATKYGIIVPKPVNVDKKSGYTYRSEKPEGIYKLADKDLSNPNLLEGILDLIGGVLGSLTVGEASICGVNEDGLPDHRIGQEDVKNQVKGLRYTSDANYIIFRDIDLSVNGENSNKEDDNWNPINLSGDMEGRKGNLQSEHPITISNVNVCQKGELNATKTQGIGFFGTITSQLDINDIGKVKGETLVKNINLSQVSVDNQSTRAKADISLVSGLLTLVGGLLGKAVDVITGILGLLIPGLKGTNLGTLVEDLLTLQAKRPDNFATGAFAGRIMGKTKVENCTVDNATVTSVKGMSGGFVGYTEGIEQYEGLSKILEGVVDILAKLLNIIPGVGLGDLISLLLQKDIPLGQLIIVGYEEPVLNNCSVTLTTGNIGKENTDYNGGFAGMQIATEMINCSVSNVKTVQAQTGAGGFAGISRDAVMRGALKDIGLNIYNFDVCSKQTNCSVNVTNSDIPLKITAQKDYSGGFNGVMTNSVSTNCTVNGIKSVKSGTVDIPGKYAGGFTGRATIGFGTVFGQDNEQNNSLLGAVSGIVDGVLAPGNEDKQNTLLTLTGLRPSEIHGCCVSGTNWTVEATGDYAGGLIGQGEGVKISDNTNIHTVIEGLASVNAKNYAGGIAGGIIPANPVGLLNNTLGLGSYLPFEMRATDLKGNNLTVTATEKFAAGGSGMLLCGLADHVNITGIQKVEAANFVGGLAGVSGSGSLVKNSGIELNILGKPVLKVNNLLSLIDGMKIEVNNSNVEGIAGGMEICANGSNVVAGDSVLAGGLIGEAEGIQLKNTNVKNLKSVWADKKAGKESIAGGMVGKSITGGLLGIAEESGAETKLPGILNITNLIDVVPYLLPTYTNSKTTFVTNGENPQVQADYAGGFFGQMNSGEVNPEPGENEAAVTYDQYVVYGLENVKGTDYAGGFAGKVEAGSVAAAKGLSLLSGIVNIDLNNILKVLSVYIPSINSAGVKSAEKGFVVEATAKDSSAGGYVGQASGATITNSEVTSLKHTEVKPPEDLEATDGSSYFGTASKYAVKAGRYAGGFVGRADIDSAAQVGGSLSVADILNLNNLLSALNVVATKIENCDVNGSIGGFSVLANGEEKVQPAKKGFFAKVKAAVTPAKAIGKAGGFVGEGSGCQITNSNVTNFAYIIGQEMAGGYAGHLEPGNVAAVLGEDQNILNGLIGVKDTLASLVNAFIPIIKNSKTTAIPCGGAVRAEGTTDTDRTRGLAGGYVGYNHGAKIDGTGSECAVVRLRSVYGTEAAGGFTGLMENADLTGTGNLKLLFGLVTVDNLLGLLQAVYPTETHTAVYGPLRQMDVDTWNAWAEAVGSKGVYGYQFPKDKVESQAELDKKIPQYAYGYNVKAGRDTVGTSVKQIGDAGGYVGKMEGGIITEAHAWDTKDVTAYKSAGGFAGEMLTGGVAKVGSISLIDGKVPITDSIGAVQTFVPVIRNSDITGYQSGLSVTATGIPQQDKKVEKVGYAGGYVGHVQGGQVWGNWNNAQTADTFSVTDAKEDVTNNRCFVGNLRRVNGTNAVGGFGGLIEPGSAAAVDTASSEGLLGGLLQHLISTPDDLVEVLNATMSTAEAVDVKPWDEYGIVIDGVYSEGNNTKYAKAVGGFAGELQGTVIGKKDNPAQGVIAENIRSVTGGKHVGGFFGYADVASVAEVSNSGSAGGETSILGSLVGLGSVKALDAFRTFIYDSSVTGAKGAGLTVEAKEVSKYGYINDPSFTGNAGGFGGTLRNGSVKGSKVEDLRSVAGKNYVGGFVGHMDKGGVVDVENVSLLEKFLSAGADVLGAFGSHVDDSQVIGIPEGFTVSSQNNENTENKQEIVGGFAGYADIARMQGNTVRNLREVSSGQIAGGFAGRTSFTYLANIKVDSKFVNQLVELLNRLLKELLKLDKIPTDGSVVTIDLGIIKVDVVGEGQLLHVNLLGLDIGIELAKEKQLAKIHIGDSVIEVHCANDGGLNPNDENLKNEINISLIKANRTKIDGCSVTGVENGYNVYGGGATADKKGTGNVGYAGGFVGYNDEGLLKNNTMDLADVIKGTDKLVGEFTGKTSLKTINTAINDTQKIEGENNFYYVYRLKRPAGVEDDHLNAIYNGNWKLNVGYEEKVVENPKYDKYKIQHRNPKELVESGSQTLHKAVWKKADLTRDADQKIRIPAKVYVDEGQADLMLGRDTAEVPDYPGKAPGAMQDPCETGAGIKIQKIWIDNDDKEKQRPKQINVHLTQNDVRFGEPIAMDSSMMEPDSSIWTTVVDAPANDQDGKKYTYDVTEDPIPGYATIYKKSEDGYTLYIYNYLISDLLRKDTVVIDYGLPVDIDVLTNDKLLNAKEEVGVQGTLSGVTITKPELGSASTTAGNNVTGTYGTANVQDVTKGVVRYIPNSMKMNSLERLYYEVQIDANNIKNDQKYVYGEVTVIPATEIYYEDNFSAITYTDGKLKDGTEVKWEIVTDGTTADQVQDTDRPSKDRLLRDWDDWYGNDSHYKDDVKYSNGTSHKITIPKEISKKGAIKPKAEFSFTGTGVEVITLTSGVSGMLQMRIYDAQGKRVEAKNDDTYYGYILQNGKWEVDKNANETNALYQVPVLKTTGLPYGTYRVELIPTYIPAIDVAGKERYDLYIDAIRVYDPVDKSGENKDYKEIEDVYNQDGENNPKFKELREILLNANKISELDQNGAVFVDGKGAVTDMKEYESYGPKHEVYLAPGQAISFTLWANKIPDRVRISGKLAMGSSVDLSVAAGVTDDFKQLGWTAFRKANYQLSTAHDMFYDFTEQCIWEEVETPNGEMKYKTRYPVVIMNSSSQSNNILSLTNLKWTGSTGGEQIEGPKSNNQEQTTDNAIELIATVNQDNVMAAYALLNEKPEKTIRIQYQNLQGETLNEEKTLYQEEGTSYDVTKWLDQEIAGYTKIEVSGDDVQGTVDQDKVIKVVYGKDYTLTIKYQDKNGKEIVDTVKEKIVEGTTYDVTEQCKRPIKGYTVVETKGDPLHGVVKKELNIQVIYEKEKAVSIESHWESNSQGWWYVHEDGSYPVNQFEKIKGYWYYFNEYGYMVTGWKWVNGKCYYFYGDGHMASNEIIDGSYVDASGAWVTDHWESNSKGWWYVHGDGSYPVNQFEKIKGYWYYFNEYGYMVTGWKWVNGKCYYFYGDGHMASNETIDGSYVDASGAWVTDHWESNSKGWWYVHGDGSYPVNRFEKIKGYWYYFNEYGYMVTGWKWVNGKCYYFYGDGHMASNETIDGSYVDASGAWVA